MLKSLRITSTHIATKQSRVTEHYFEHSLDKLAKHIRGLTGAQAYQLKKNGKIEVEENGCKIKIEIVDVKPPTPLEAEVKMMAKKFGSRERRILTMAVIIVLIIGVLLIGAKLYWQNFEKCLAAGKSQDFCHDLLR